MAIQSISRRELLRSALGAGGLLAVGARLELLAAEPEKMRQVVGRPQDLETPAATLDEEFTPNDTFFVRSHFGPAILEPERYRLEIGGRVRKPLSLRLDDLKHLPRVTVAAVLQCAGNARSFYRPRVPGAQWGRGALGQARWTGVRLRDLLARAGVEPGAKFVRLLGGDRPPLPTVPPFARSVPLEKAMHPDTLLAYEMNGAPLPLLHGAPVRAVLPGWVGDDWIKWLTSIRVEDQEDAGFYMKTGYRMPTRTLQPGEPPKPEEMQPMTSMVIKSLITRPRTGQVLAAAPSVIAGLAFAGERGVRTVEISVDGGRSWRPAALDPPKGLGAWQRWQASWTPAAGSHRLLCRATDEQGEQQPARPAWNPGGYLWNGWDEVRCEVRS
jgi:DMSO/TMAO reductase YedYZ molybdopterin-dependent catalytic subunit